ncbi:hypothetical protein D9611_007660 [Ephemerocybe angulata]|uniref:Uncharacterized protein n=1 Tax=Ephemerocybe angulata TaxID=980116 RepID=A0A8H5BXT1_9AGAR|nr:hypothetical protein D9611_007660 [Tulosesus angulatus]
MALYTIPKSCMKPIFSSKCPRSIRWSSPISQIRTIPARPRSQDTLDSHAPPNLKIKLEEEEAEDFVFGHSDSTYVADVEMGVDSQEDRDVSPAEITLIEVDASGSDNEQSLFDHELFGWEAIESAEQAALWANLNPGYGIFPSVPTLEPILQEHQSLDEYFDETIGQSFKPHRPGHPSHSDLGQPIFPDLVIGNLRTPTPSPTPPRRPLLSIETNTPQFHLNDSVKGPSSKPAAPAAPVSQPHTSPGTTHDTPAPHHELTPSPTSPGATDAHSSNRNGTTQPPQTRVHSTPNGNNNDDDEDVDMDAADPPSSDSESESEGELEDGEIPEQDAGQAPTEGAVGSVLKHYIAGFLESESGRLHSEPIQRHVATTSRRSVGSSRRGTRGVAAGGIRKTRKSTSITHRTHRAVNLHRPPAHIPSILARPRTSSYRATITPKQFSTIQPGTHYGPLPISVVHGWRNELERLKYMSTMAGVFKNPSQYASELKSVVSQIERNESHPMLTIDVLKETRLLEELKAFQHSSTGPGIKSLKPMVVGICSRWRKRLQML